MPDRRTLQDIERVQARIARLRARWGLHWRELEQMPAQTASHAWSSLSETALGFRNDPSATSRRWLWGLLSAAANWYFSQPDAARRIWRMVYPVIRHWKSRSKSK